MISDWLGDVETLPLIAFVHIPKTAGTTVNKVLFECSHRCIQVVHIEGRGKSEFLDRARRADWISGHMRREDMAKSLVWLDRKIEYFSVVRDPVSQLHSHLNYSFHRANLPNYEEITDEEERKTDAAIMAVNFEKDNEVIDFLMSHRKLFKNIQSKFLIGSKYKNLSTIEIEKRIESFVFIASELNIKSLYERFGFAWIPEQSSNYKENIANKYLSRDLFERPNIRSFCDYYLFHDLRLYNIVLKTQWGAARKPFRPAFKLGSRTTHENFDEKLYLDANHDVMNAVKAGLFKSGHEHFMEFGQTEERMSRIKISPDS